MLDQSKDKLRRIQSNSRLAKIYDLIRKLESNFFSTESLDQQVLLAVKLSHLRNQSVAKQLEEALTENLQLTNMFQFDDNLMPRTSYSTMSLVHLQYKYDEITVKYNGLLKMLDLRLSDLRKCNEQNDKLKEELAIIRTKLQHHERVVSRVTRKLNETKRKKNEKIVRLKNERDTLRIVHNRLVALLNCQCMERDEVFSDLIKYSSTSHGTQLIQEIRKNNLLSYENFQFRQEIEYLRSILKTVREPKSICHVHPENTKLT